MTVNETKDILQLLAQSSRVLITTKSDPGFDDVSSALAWSLYLVNTHKKKVDVVFTTAHSHQFKFLPNADIVSDKIQSARHFIIQVNVSKNKVSELSYDVHDDMLEIKIKPQDGMFTSKDISFAESAFAYDLIITLGVPELSSIGKLFDQNRELFFNTPIINIDRQSSNVRFGQVNAVYLTTTSLAEISYAIMGTTPTKEIATCLLTGLIAATNSFQTPQVTPDTLRLASDLIVAGADRSTIVHQLFRTKDMDKLKIWGQVLSRLQQIDSSIVYSHVTQAEVAGKDIDLQGLADDLVLASPEAEVVLFFVAGATSTTIYAYGRENYDMVLLFERYKPIGYRKRISFTIEKGGTETENEIIGFVREQAKLIHR